MESEDAPYRRTLLTRGRRLHRTGIGVRPVGLHPKRIGRFAGAGALGAGDLIHSVSGRWAGAGEVGRLTDQVAPPLICGAISGPQLPELCDTTFGAAPLPDDVI